jgi:aspartyl-tRNA(Asn)/glutamyl-tRNA(Gln) amidotransferase subunit C
MTGVSQMPMLSDKEIQHIATLARIKLTGAEEEKFKKELSSILEYIETLKKVDTEHVEPLYQTTGLVNAVREDVSRPAFMMDEKLNRLLIGQAPDTQERYVRVKSALKK